MQNNANPVLSIKAINKAFSGVKVLNDINLEIHPGEVFGILGENGAGKSTLLSIMGAMNSPTEGRYVVDGIDVYTLDVEQRADFRREFLGFIFQSFHLIPYLTVLENTMLPLTILLSSLVGAAIGIFMIVFAGRGRSVPIPFGPYLAIAGMIALLYGPALTRTYLGPL